MIKLANIQKTILAAVLASSITCVAFANDFHFSDMATCKTALEALSEQASDLADQEQSMNERYEGLSGMSILLRNFAITDSGGGVVESCTNNVCSYTYPHADCSLAGSTAGSDKNTNIWNALLADKVNELANYIKNKQYDPNYKSYQMKHTVVHCNALQNGDVDQSSCKLTFE